MVGVVAKVEVMCSDGVAVAPGCLVGVRRNNLSRVLEPVCELLEYEAFEA